ncbi:MAG TPA: hypothetical protein VHU90_04240, partial [Galbitalea sp.]|nr:hypothetical protein [Galbitalea sp.]
MQGKWAALTVDDGRLGPRYLAVAAQTLQLTGGLDGMGQAGERVAPGKPATVGVQRPVPSGSELMLIYERATLTAFAETEILKHAQDGDGE